jgi:hypothetical protein
VRFSGVPVHERLGFSKLRGLLQSFDGFTVTGVPPRELLSNENKANKRTVVAQFILSLIDGSEASGSVLTTAALGNLLLTRFPGGPVYQQLGHARLIDLLRSVPEITVEGTGVHRPVRRAQTLERLEEKPKERAASAEGNAILGVPIWDNAELRNQVHTFVKTLLTESISSGRELTMVYAGSRLSREFPGERPVYQRLGHARLTDCLLSFGEFRLIDIAEGNTLIAFL